MGPADTPPIEGEGPVNRFDMSGWSVAKMAGIIKAARESTAALSRPPGFEAGCRTHIALVDLVWAVWPEPDVNQPRLSGHGLGILKGVPMLERVRRRNAPMDVAEIHIMFTDYAAACEACRRYGDDRENQAA